MKKKLVGNPNTKDLYNMTVPFEEWLLVDVDHAVSNPDYEEIHGEWKLDRENAGWFTDEDSLCRIRVTRQENGEWRTAGRWEEE